MKVCVTRLRERVVYTTPLRHILDSFYELLRGYVFRHPEIRFSYYNCSLDGGPATRDVSAVARADVVLIPTEQEFHYHVPGYFHTLSVAKSHEYVAEVGAVLSGKHIVLLRSDRADGADLYRTYTFPDVEFTCSIVDETDFPGGVHGLKYHFIRRAAVSIRSEWPPNRKTTDFVYWGSLKNKVAGGEASKDVRHKVLKDVAASDLICYWIGRFQGIKRDAKFAPLSDLLPRLRNARSTLCFNWLDPQAVTARYHEAVGAGVIPFAWGDYDSNGCLVRLPWQRVKSVPDFVEFVQGLRNRGTFCRRFAEVEAAYEVHPVRWYHRIFERRLSEILGVPAAEVP